MAADGTKSKFKSELPVVIHQSIMAKIYDYYLSKKINHYLLALGLYTYLYSTVRRQNNIRVWVTDTFIRKGTGIGQRLLPTIKNDLIQMDLISIHHDRKVNGVLGKRYIEVKYVWKPEALEKLFYQEQSETTEYKIARRLLTENFNPYEEIVGEAVEFDVEVNGRDEILWGDTFYFNDDEILIARVGFNGEEEVMEYTVPKNMVGEIITNLASNYKYTIKGVLNALQSS